MKKSFPRKENEVLRVKLEPNDALTVDVMRQNCIAEIYSFDEHFNQIDGITRLLHT